MNYPFNLISGISNLPSVICFLSSEIKLRVESCGLGVADCELGVVGCGHRAWRAEQVDWKPPYLSVF